VLSGNGSLRDRSGAGSPVGRRCFRLHVQVCLSAATRYELRAMSNLLQGCTKTPFVVWCTWLGLDADCLTRFQILKATNA